MGLIFDVEEEDDDDDDIDNKNNDDDDDDNDDLKDGSCFLIHKQNITFS